MKWFLQALATVLAVAYLVSCPASGYGGDYGQQVQDEEEDRDDYLDKIEEAEEEAEELEETVDSLGASIYEQERLMDELENDISEKEEKIDRSEDELEDLQASLEEKQQKLHDRLRSTYMDGWFNLSYLQVLWEAESISDFFLRLEYLGRLLERDRKLVDDVRSGREQARKEKDALIERRSELEEMEQELQSRKNRLEQRRKEAEASLDEKKDMVEEMKEDVPPPPETAPPPVEGGEGIAPEEGEIALGWHFTSMDRSHYVDNPPSETGYNVYAPVAYFLNESDGEFNVTRAPNVIDEANASGYETWVTFQEFGSDQLGEVFSDPETQTSVIEKLMERALEDKVDGINIDFEEMWTDEDDDLSNEDMRDGLTEFMEELYQETRQEGLHLSVDVVPPPNVFYDHSALAEVSDHIIVMTYDQHWGLAAGAGPVASLSWTEDKINSILDRGVPPEKLVLGVPFYSREWKFAPEEEGSQNYELDDMSHISTEVCLQIEENFDEDESTSYYQRGDSTEELKEVSFTESGELLLAEYKKDDGEDYRYQVWLENYNSLRKRYALKEEYGLAGIAAWSLEWQDADRRSWYEMRQ